MKAKQISKLRALLLSLFLIFSFNSSVSAAGEDQTMAVHFLDVGQGLSILIQSGGQNLLYDGGDQSHSDEVVSYLQQQNVQTIDYMISSHYDEDHLGGLVQCLDSFSVDTLLGSDYVHDSDLYRTFFNTATKNAVTVQYPQVGDTFSFGTGSFTVLAPSGIHTDDSNNNSVVVKLENGSNSFLFTGDAEITSEQDMISTGRNLDCDVLSLGHHGSASSTSWDFLEATSPSYAVVSCGAGNQYNHPSAETMGRLSDMGIPVFRTDKQSTIVAVSDGTTISWTQEPCNDYSSGDTADSTYAAGTETDQGTVTDTYAAESSQDADTAEAEASQDTASDTYVWLSATGEKYHSIPNCGRMNPDKARQVTKSQAEAGGYGPCSKCY